LGRPHYAAPEQVLGAVNDLNKSTDIYALGIIMFQLTTGHLPFDGDINAVLRQQRHSPLPLSSVPYRSLRKIIKKATAKEQRKRYQSAEELREAIVNAQPSPDLSKLWMALIILFSLVAGFFIGFLFLSNL
jgi:serine/threonine-protein kinase